LPPSLDDVDDNVSDDEDDSDVLAGLLSVDFDLAGMSLFAVVSLIIWISSLGFGERLRHRAEARAQPYFRAWN
jgi:hypothetical protein